MLDKGEIENKAIDPVKVNKVDSFKAIESGYIHHFNKQDGLTHIDFIKGESVEIPSKWVDIAVTKGLIAKPTKTKKG